MAKPEWGVKRLCQSCGARFYDMLRDPIVCPGCGAAFDPEILLKSRRSRPAAKTPAPAKAAKAAPVVDDDESPDPDDDLDTDAGDDDVIEDTSDLGDDDLSDVVVDEKEDESS